MTPPPPRRYMRPTGEFLTELTGEEFRKDFLAGPKLWKSGVGYALLEHFHGVRRDSYLSCGYAEGYGFYLEAHLDRLSPESQILNPVASEELIDPAPVWDGQTFMMVPRSFFVSPQQASDIAEEFWEFGSLSDGFRWADGTKLGWEFPQPDGV